MNLLLHSIQSHSFVTQTSFYSVVSNAYKRRNILFVEFAHLGSMRVMIYQLRNRGSEEGSKAAVFSNVSDSLLKSLSPIQCTTRYLLDIVQIFLRGIKNGNRDIDRFHPYATASSSLLA